MDDPLDLITIINLLNDHTTNPNHPLDNREQAQAEYFHNIITAPEIYGLNVYFKNGERSDDNGDYEGVMILLRAKEFKYNEECEVIKEPEAEIPEVVLRNRYVFRKDWFAFLEHAAGMTEEKYRELTSQNRIFDCWGLSPDKQEDIETRARIIQQQKEKEEEDLYHFKRIGEMYTDRLFWGKSVDDKATAPGQATISNIPSEKSDSHVVPNALQQMKDLKWGEVCIRILDSTEALTIVARGESVAFTYAAVGLLDDRMNEAVHHDVRNFSGGILRAHARTKQTALKRDVLLSVTKSKKEEAINKLVSNLARILKKVTGIKDSPFQRKKKGEWPLNFSLTMEAQAPIPSVPGKDAPLEKVPGLLEEVPELNDKSSWPS